MQRDRRPSQQTIAVLRALAANPTAWRYGYDLCQELDLKAGSMYPILVRLADRGLLKMSWEPSLESGRPPRHLYRITRAGLEIVAELAPKARRVARNRAQLRTESP